MPNEKVPQPKLDQNDNLSNLDRQRRRCFLSSFATITAATTALFPIQHHPFPPLQMSLLSSHLSWQSSAIANAYEPPTTGGIKSLQSKDINNIKDEDISFISSPKRRTFPYNENWVGTSLPLLSISAAASYATQPQSQQEVITTTTFPMGRWPDPMLRRPANLIPSKMFHTNELKCVAETLRNTARVEGAVGLAAQQCGIDGSLVFLDDVANYSNNDDGENGIGNARQFQEKANSEGRRSFFSLNSNMDRYGSKMMVMGEGEAQKGKRDTKQTEYNDKGGIFLVNPRIISRSSEVDMKVWTEQCLVLPPDFTATVLRDDIITVEYETLEGQTRTVKLDGELSRAAQHEMDHDRGVLIVDHVSLDEMSNDVMRMLESRGHEERMLQAYERYMSDPMVGVV